MVVDGGHASLPVSSAAPGFFCVPKLASMSALHLSHFLDEDSSHVLLNFVHSIELWTILWAKLESIEVWGNPSSQMLVYLLVIEIESLESLEEVQNLLLDKWIFTFVADSIIETHAPSTRSTKRISGLIELSVFNFEARGG